MKLIKGIILLIPLLLITSAITHGQASQRITINNSSKSLQLEHAANISYNNGNDLLAISIYKQALQLNPNDPKILTNLGGAEFDTGNYSGATFYFHKALSSDPKHQGALLGMGEIEEVLGGNNNQSAQNYFKQILTIPATTDYERLVHVISLTHLGHYAQAMSIVNQVLKSKPSINILMVKGDLLLYLGNYTGALSIFNHVLITHPSLASAIDDKAIVLADLGHYKEALELFHKLVSLNQKDVTTLYNIGVLLDKGGNFTAALKAYIHAQNLTPHNKDVLWNEGLNLGIVSLKHNHFADALKVYNTMLRVAPHNPYLLQARNYAESKLLESMCCVGGSSLP